LFLKVAFNLDSFLSEQSPLLVWHLINEFWLCHC